MKFCMHLSTRIQDKRDELPLINCMTDLALEAVTPLLVSSRPRVSVAVAVAAAAFSTLALVVLNGGNNSPLWPLFLAVTVDAFLVRGVLVPAFMKVMGEANWWAPRPLREWHLRRNLAPDRNNQPERYPRVEVEVLSVVAGS